MLFPKPPPPQCSRHFQTVQKVLLSLFGFLPAPRYQDHRPQANAVALHRQRGEGEVRPGLPLLQRAALRGEGSSRWVTRAGRGGAGGASVSKRPPARAVSLENVLLDVRELNRGMELTRREYSMHGHNTMLKEFIAHSESKLRKLQDDAKIAQVRPRARAFLRFTSSKLAVWFEKDAFDEVVKFFGENAKTTPPSVFFPVFCRFVKAYRVSGAARSFALLT